MSRREKQSTLSDLNRPKILRDFEYNAPTKKEAEFNPKQSLKKFSRSLAKKHTVRKSKRPSQVSLKESLKKTDTQSKKSKKSKKLTKKEKEQQRKAKQEAEREAKEKEQQKAKQKEMEKKRTVEIVDKLFNIFHRFKKETVYEDNVDQIKDDFERHVCNGNIFKVVKSKCGIGSYKVVVLCDQDMIDCHYVYAFDFRHHANEEGDEKFMKGGTFGGLSKLDYILGITPIFHHKLYCGYRNLQRVDFMLLYNNGPELFDVLYSHRRTRKMYQSGTVENIWFCLVFLLTTLYSLGKMHQKGFVHLDLKQENMLAGNRHNPERNFLMIADFGFVTHESEKYSVGGTADYLIPKVARIYGRMESSRNLLFTDLLEQDIHSIGYNVIQVMLTDYFRKTASKPECLNIRDNCGSSAIKISKKSEKQYCKVGTMDYLSCNNDVDSTLGLRGKFNRFKNPTKQMTSLPKMPESIFQLLKKYCLMLSDYGFKTHLDDNRMGRQYAITSFNILVTRMKQNKKDFAVVKDVIGGNKTEIKLNPAIWKEIE